MSANAFGQIDQTPVFEVTIASQAGASAKILTWGAVVRDLVVPASNGLQRVVLGLNTLDDYLNYSPSFGAVPGRFANRIANGRFVLDGVAYQLERKPGQKHTLHGGPHGFGHRIWKLGAYDSSSVELIIESPDGDSGVPGAMTATCVYRLLEPATLRVELSAVSDRPTIVNLTQHSYFNLDGSPDILDHELTLFADFYTPADEELIPTGEIRAVAGTPYDFRTPRTVRNPTLTPYDTNFVAALERDEDGLAQIAALRTQAAGNAALVAALDALDAKAAEIGGVTQAGTPQSSGVTAPSNDVSSLMFVAGELGQLSGAVEGVDAAPSMQVMNAFAQAQKLAAAAMAKWSGVKAKDLAAVNAQLKQAELQEIKVEAAPAGNEPTMTPPQQPATPQATAPPPAQ